MPKFAGLRAAALCCLVGAMGLAQPPAARSAVAIAELATGLIQPTAVKSANDQSGRLFIAEQQGTIRIFDGNQLVAGDFLDIRTKITTGGSEQGLLGLVFHPDYANNGFFYVNYSRAADGDTVIARYSVNPADADDALEASELVLLVVDQDATFTNHNGGDMQFDADGLLFVALGDDGGSGDPDRNAQDLTNLHGTIIRIDVDDQDVGLQYAIPGDNPFVGVANSLDEIWVYGLRNPWRFSFDRATDDLFIGDVGQDAFEEINFQAAASTAGENYGWDCKEGTGNFQFVAACNSETFTDPIVQHAHTGQGCGAGDNGSITGGYRYRGAGSPPLQGAYIYADFCDGKIYEATQGAGGAWSTALSLDTGLGITSFGEDDDGELYFVHRGGSLYSVPEPSSALCAAAAIAALALNARRSRQTRRFSPLQ